MNEETADAGRPRMHVIATEVSAAALARGVARVLTGRNPAPADGSAWRRGGVTAAVVAAWDGPELRLSWNGGPVGASRTGRLLAEIAAASGGGAVAPGTPGGPGTEGQRVAYLAWRALMDAWRATGGARREITPAGRGPSGCARESDAAGPVFVFDHVGPPPLPPGWLLRAWFPDHGSFLFSPQGRRPSVRSPFLSQAGRAGTLTRVWRTVTDELAADPGLPLSRLSVPPRAFVLGPSAVPPERPGAGPDRPG